MPDVDYKALCAELLADYDNCHYRSELSDRARSMLAQPDPLAPTNEELKQLLFDDHRSAIEFSCDTKAEGDIVIDNHIDFAHAVLARWGTPANTTREENFDD